MAVGVTMSPEGNRVRCAAVEGKVEHGFVGISPDKIYKYVNVCIRIFAPSSTPQVANSLNSGLHDAFGFEPLLLRPTVSVNTCITRLSKTLCPYDIFFMWLNSEQFS